MNLFKGISNKKGKNISKDLTVYLWFSRVLKFLTVRSVFEVGLKIRKKSRNNHHEDAMAVCLLNDDIF